ncbi:MAG: aldehyde ferredoxin oxidoreductase C-terminal domain-containing protein, partial [Desulfovibrionales bacterium]
YRDMYTWDELQTLVPLLTGLSLDKSDLRDLAGEIVAMTRAFNLREGLTPEMDRLPKRLTREVLPSGHAVTEEEMDRMVNDYYRLRGWRKRA